MIGHLADQRGSTVRFDVVKKYTVIALGATYMTTPLNHAVSLRKWDWVEWLLERGADPEAHDRHAFDHRNVMPYCKAHAQRDMNGRGERRENDVLLRLIEATKKKGQAVHAD